MDATESRWLKYGMLLFSLVGACVLVRGIAGAELVRELCPGLKP
jgi:hypothetical protein